MMMVRLHMHLATGLINSLEEEAKKDPRFNFESDVDGEPEEELNLATLPDDEEQEDEDEGAEEEEQGDEESPEDDFNAAWEVLDLARVIYEKRQDEDDEIKLKLADTYLALGDVSLETGKRK
jgi:HAT1-interacting factor 1